MKFFVKSSVMLVLFMLAVTYTADAQSKRKANKDTESWKYEVECVGTGTQGSALIKVWSYSRKPKVAIEQAKKNAIHAIIFQGYAGGKMGCKTQKPLVRNPNIENEKADFFKEFFAEGGKYMKYVSVTNDGAVGAGDRLKISKREYKIGVIVSVRKDQLRKDLENAGIVKGLSSGF